MRLTLMAALFAALVLALALKSNHDELLATNGSVESHSHGGSSSGSVSRQRLTTKLAGEEGFEPTPGRLTTACSTAELPPTKLQKNRRVGSTYQRLPREAGVNIITEPECGNGCLHASTAGKKLMRY